MRYKKTVILPMLCVFVVLSILFLSACSKEPNINEDMKRFYEGNKDKLPEWMTVSNYRDVLRPYCEDGNLSGSPVGSESSRFTPDEYTTFYDLLKTFMDENGYFDPQ